MIRPLRTAHLRIVTTLAVLLPIVVIAAVANRTPAAEPPTTHAEDFPLNSERGMFRAKLSAGSSSIALTTVHDAVIADPLVYWTAGRNSDAALTSATFLGPLVDAQKFTLPEPHGTILIYSNAEHSVRDTLNVGGGQ